MIASAPISATARRRAAVEDRRYDEADHDHEAGAEPDQRPQPLPAAGRDHEHGEQHGARAAAAAARSPRVRRGRPGRRRSRRRGDRVREHAHLVADSGRGPRAPGRPWSLRPPPSSPLSSSTVTRRQSRCPRRCRRGRRPRRPPLAGVRCRTKPAGVSIVRSSGQSATRPMPWRRDASDERQDQQVHDERTPCRDTSRSATCRRARGTRKPPAASSTIVPPGGRSA